MAGAILMILVLVIVLPVLILLSMAVLAALIGSATRRNVAKAYEDSELLALAESSSSA